MHIALTAPEYPTPARPEGGLGTYIRKTALALAGRGHRVTVFCLTDQPVTEADDAIKLVSVQRRRAGPWWSWISRLRPFKSIADHRVSAKALARAVWEEHDRNPIDVIQTSNYFASGDALRYNGRVPVVCRVSWYPPYWRAGTRGPRTLSDYAWDWLDLRQVADADRAYGPSKFLADAYERGQGLKIDLIRTPVDTTRSHDVDTSFYDEALADKKYLLYFGNINGVKGVDLLLPIVTDLFKDFPDTYLVLIGRDDGLPGGEPLIPLLKSAAGACADNIIYHEPMSKPLLKPVIENAEAVLIPSRIDNYPNVCLEAQQLGRPVIASNNSSLEEMVEDGETGLLFNNGDAVGLKYAICRCLQRTEQEKVQWSDHIQTRFNAVASEDRIGELENFFKEVIQTWRH